jgi:RND family efflux transporter MFP subunit
MADVQDPTATPPRAAPHRGLLMLVVVLLVAGAVFWWWRSRTEDGTGPSAAAAPASAASGAAGGPPVSVSTVRAERRDVPVQLEATGTVTALNSVDVKAQVASIVTRVHVREGQFVKAGEPLFTLDARNDEANLGKAQAQLQKDLASLADAQRQLARSRELFAQNFISQGAVDTNQALVEAQQAGVAADRAAIESARVALSYSRIHAPQAGRIGQVSVVVGSNVQPNGTTLVTITQLDPIAVGFGLPQRNLPDALAALRDGGGKVHAVLPDGRGALTGKLQFVDNAVDPGTGTVRVKAVFDNKEQKLWPGAFVGVKLAVQTLQGAIVVPQAAIVQSTRGKVLFIVDANGKAAARPVEVVYATGTDAVVTGLQGGERVIVDGRQNVRPGGAVVERSGAGPRGGRAGAAGAAASGAASGAGIATP